MGRLVLEQPTCNKFVCWPAHKAEAGGGEALGFYSTMGIEIGMAGWVADHSTLSSLCAERKIYLIARLYIGILKYGNINIC